MNSTHVPTDFHVDDFVEILATLNQMPPVVTGYEEAIQLAAPAGTPQGRWYHNQKLHMMDWFASQTTLGGGSYTRKKPNFSARTTYNRLLTVPGILWIAEALGEDPAIVQEAAQAADGVPRRSQTAAARKVIPWQRIAELAETHRRSRV